jgi:hypothetical protein
MCGRFSLPHEPFDLFVGRDTLFQRPTDFIGGRKEPVPEFGEEMAAAAPSFFKIFKHADFYVKIGKMSNAI